MQETVFSVPVESVSRYDYTWLTDKMQVLKKHMGSRVLPVPLNFYQSNTLQHAEFPVSGLDMLDADCNLRNDKIPPTRQYFKSLQIHAPESKKATLHLVSYRAIPESVTLRYTDQAARAQKCLAAQLIALGEITFLQDAASLVLPAYESIRVNLAPYERTQLLAQAGRNIYAGLAAAYLKNPAHKVRVLLSNSVPHSAAQVLPFNELAGKFVGLDPEELMQVKNAAIAQNGSIAYIPDLNKRIEIAIDTAVVWQLWQTAKIPFFKDASGEPLIYEDLLLSIRKSLTTTDTAGVIQERKLKALYASYARDNDEKKKWGESINLPYQRSSVERLMKLQIQMLIDLYDFSAVGLETDTYVALEMPARQKFPLLHVIVRPLARKIGLEEKRDGADTQELEGSLTLLRSAFAQAGK